MRNTEYIRPENPNPKRVTESAILQNGKIWTGKRHFELISQIQKDGGERVSIDQQGFLTDDGLFVTRSQAWAIAIKAKQIDKSFDFKKVLTSEDLW